MLLPRTGPDEFWQTLSERFAQANARQWKYLAMLALRENAGWSLEQIANAFRHNPATCAGAWRKSKRKSASTFSMRQRGLIQHAIRQ